MFWAEQQENPIADVSWGLGKKPGSSLHHLFLPCYILSGESLTLERVLDHDHQSLSDVRHFLIDSPESRVEVASGHSVTQAPMGVEQG